MPLGCVASVGVGKPNKALISSDVRARPTLKLLAQVPNALKAKSYSNELCVCKPLSQCLMVLYGKTSKKTSIDLQIVSMDCATRVPGTAKLSSLKTISR